MLNIEQQIIGMYNLNEQIGKYTPSDSVIRVDEPISDEGRQILTRDLANRSYNPLVLPEWIVSSQKPLILVDQEKIGDGSMNFDLGYEVSDFPTGRFTYIVPRIGMDMDADFMMDLARDYLMTTGQSRILVGQNDLKVIDQMFLGGDVLVMASPLTEFSQKELLENIALEQKVKYGLNSPDTPIDRSLLR